MKKNYYLFNPGRMSRKDNTLKFEPVTEDGKFQKPRYLPVEQVDQLFCFGSVDANSAVYNFLGKNDISVHFFDYYENYTGSFQPKRKLLAGAVQIAQVKTYLSEEERISLAQQFIEGAAHNILRNLKYYNTRGKDATPFIEKIEGLRKQVSQSKNIRELMGIEGNIRMTYYDAFPLIVNDFNMNGRTMQPPQDEVNSLISFGNMLCYAECLRSIHQTQLDPTISFLHEPGYRRYSLALDLAEIFKPVLVDRLIFKVLNKKIVQKNDFDTDLNRIVLKEKGRKAFISGWEERMGQTIMHRSLKREVSYKHLIKLECYKIVKDLMKLDNYKPFKAWW
ncbi:CRISPR-associated endonuclease Cas1 [Salinivirga cyanobacteriivorans]|uniref:CRISPR-associated endonuclease Cas1 n=1 Tax=Salinivirga cyanobacteriivorans TaxID=1307839 RepID=A0A0S2I4E8_9BACT|nr:type I-B CRISPR-associated endonuclease Cas1b [Salinivirga cyanobacteriivorans]ALO17061.1 CRISPR-associated endonuclease Cas1 [Salinivirga cyanobacteriivorans]